MALEKNNTPLPVEGAPCSCINSSKVLELLECQVCYSYMNPPIHQCQNGHTLCSKCKIKVHNKCPTCREEFGNIRCLALEKLAESLLLPCKYNSSGCSDRFPHSAKPNHELQCNFRPYNCTYDNFRCSVTGDIPFLVSHLQFVHEADMYEKCTFSKLYLIADPRFGDRFCKNGSPNRGYSKLDLPIDLSVAMNLKAHSLDSQPPGVMPNNQAGVVSNNCSPAGGMSPGAGLPPPGTNRLSNDVGTPTKCPTDCVTGQSSDSLRLKRIKETVKEMARMCGDIISEEDDFLIGPFEILELV